MRNRETKKKLIITRKKKQYLTISSYLKDQKIKHTSLKKKKTISKYFENTKNHIDKLYYQIYNKSNNNIDLCLPSDTYIDIYLCIYFLLQLVFYGIFFTFLKIIFNKAEMSNTSYT